MLLPNFEYMPQHIQIAKTSKEYDHCMAFCQQRYKDLYDVEFPDNDVYRRHSLTLHTFNSNQKVQGCARLVFDSPMGLPEDGLFSSYANHLRQHHDSLLEIGRFAISTSPDVVNLHRDYFLAFYLIGIQCQIDAMLISVNAKHWPFYDNIIGAELLPDTNPDGFGSGETFITANWMPRHTNPNFFKWLFTNQSSQQLIKE